MVAYKWDGELLSPGKKQHIAAGKQNLSLPARGEGAHAPARIWLVQ